ncbi:LacI family DNA-binding transcriptional regulator [Nocardiopsis lambiniae]|uniref:LacI family DNA-binding transcriptional regulator n=1 Tax=Nocardiopsis lambiniae TaxID=3075539 RepID=A0ABU2M5K0_9ACTN|nr:LacI family DNA-binding transcriptional regulator [Nocardiopsis sp. DSM 44743]MDT0327907.1 LacI family DNA-binding transcriptional regulator [Nocardiopsis sp. DSM 44743]
MTSIRPRPATITDIARQAGVSTATVSYVLNDAPAGARIPEETRARVRAIADELGYVPHANARSLRTGSRDLVLYVHFDVVHGPLATGFLYGFTRALRDLGYTLMQYGAERHRGVKAARSWAALRPAAVIAGDDRLTPAGVALLLKAGIRVFGMGSDPAAAKGTGLSTLIMDHRAIGLAAGRDLLERGYRDLAVVVPVDPPLRVMGEGRLEGVREAAAEVGASVRVHEMEYSPGSAAGIVAAWGEEGLPEGVFGYNDEFAGLLLGALLDAGVDVPGRVGLMGADDVMLCRMLRPTLSSVRVESESPEEIARRVVASITEGTEVHLSPWSPVPVRRQT